MACGRPSGLTSASALTRWVAWVSPWPSAPPSPPPRNGRAAGRALPEWVAGREKCFRFSNTSHGSGSVRVPRPRAVGVLWQAWSLDRSLGLSASGAAPQGGADTAPSHWAGGQSQSRGAQSGGGDGARGVRQRDSGPGTCGDEAATEETQRTVRTASPHTRLRSPRRPCPARRRGRGRTSRAQASTPSAFASLRGDWPSELWWWPCEVGPGYPSYSRELEGRRAGV